MVTALSAGLSACASEPTATESDFGNSVRSMVMGQTVNPNAAEENRGRHAEQGDGQRGEAVMEAYRDDVTTSEEASRDLVIDLGNLSGS
jgi:hypothetical protein